ncbi:MAG TPA: hypothetical protein VN678_02960 [Acidobacteriaceae bacterium]|nr:hypothetical protein [Acidobacteriaceae bacterium]
MGDAPHAHPADPQPGLAYPEDANVWATVDAYLWGPNLLVAPVFEKGATERKVYLPAGAWYDYWTAARSRAAPPSRTPRPSTLARSSCARDRSCRLGR